MRRRLLKSKRLTRTAPSTVVDPEPSHRHSRAHTAGGPGLPSSPSSPGDGREIGGSSNSMPLHSPPADGSSGRRHCGGRPSMPHQAKNEAENLPCVEDLQPHGRRRLSIGSRNAVAGDIVGEAVKGTDEMAIAHACAGGRTQRGAQVRTYRLGYADGPLIVAPGDNVLPKPLLLDQSYHRSTGRFPVLAAVADDVRAVEERKWGGQLNTSGKCGSLKRYLVKAFGRIGAACRAGFLIVMVSDRTARAALARLFSPRVGGGGAR